MKNYRLLTIIFCLVFFGGIVSHQNKPPRLSSSVSTECTECLDFFPQAARVSPKFSNPPHYKIYAASATRQKELIGIAFHTTDLAPDVKGYGGPIDVLVGVNTQGTIVGLKLISHKETTSYISKLDSFLSQFVHRGLSGHWQIGDDIDGITGATITSTAITQAIQKSLAVASAQILDKRVETTRPPKHLPVEQILWPIILFGLATFGIVGRNRFSRRTALVGGFIYLGLLKKNMVSAVQVANIGLGNFPPFHDSPLWYLLLILTVLSGLLLGMVYCGSVCPFAGVQEFMFCLGRRLGLKKAIISDEIDRRARYLKHILLISVIGLSLWKTNPNIANVEVYVTFFTHDATRLAWLVLILTLIGSLFYFRFWCKYFCPIGALNGLITKTSLFKIRPTGQCTSCGQCQALCPTQAIKTTADNKPCIDAPECILCNRCVEGCPQQAFKLSLRDHETKR